MTPRSERGPLKIQFIITSMPVGGAETLLVNLLRRMDSSLVEPEVVCLKEPGPLGQEIAAEFQLHSHLIRGKGDLSVVPRLAGLMRRREIDAVITVGAGDKMFWGRIAAFVAGVPVIASALHSTGWPDGVGRLNRLLTPITDAFIGVAESHGKFLEEFERFPADKVHVIRNGVDCDRFVPNEGHRWDVRQELGLDGSAQLAGIVAALRSEKNHAMLIQTAAQLAPRCPNLHWIVIGDGPERPRIEALITEYEVGDRVHLLGTRHDTPRLVSALDVFTLCSLNEASPVSILEALACGVPVVASDVGSISESVLEGETGFLFPSNDVAAMSAAVEQLVNDRPLRERMGLAGRELVLQTGSLQSMVAGYQNLVTEIYDAAAARGTAVSGVAKAQNEPVCSVSVNQSVRPPF